MVNGTHDLRGAMSEWWTDVRYAARTLRRSSGFAAVAVLTLALGIGANSAIFSVVNGVVLRPLPYEEPEALVSIATQFPTLGFDRFWMSPPEFMELGEWNRSFESLGGYRSGLASVGGREQPLRVTSAVATAGFFTTLGVAPVIGRTFTEAEDLPNGPAVAVLSYDLWQGAFAGDRSVVGTTTVVNGIEREIVGVMPSGFDIDDAGVQIWTPAALDGTNRQNRGSHFLNVVARLRPGATLDMARAEIDGLIERWQSEFAGTHAPHPENHRLVVNSLQEEMVGDIRPALLMLLGAVGFVLLIACANVGNLLLARAESRQKEIAVRAALGAGSGRLLRQFLTESVLLALIGGTLGLFLAYAGLRGLLATSPGSVPRAAAIALDGNVLLFTLAVSVFTGILFGLAPVLYLTPGSVNRSLREGGHRTTAGSAKLRLRRLLVIAEVALAVILVVGSGLMLRSFAALTAVDPGFDPENVLTFGLFLPAANYPDGPAQVAFHQRLAERVGASPGVLAVAGMSGLPPQRDVNANDMMFEGYNFQPNTGMAVPNADYWQFVTTDYLATMQIPLVAGRGFTIGDDAAATPVVLINETLARVFYGDQDPIGHRLRPGFGNPPWFTIVGIVKDVKQGGLQEQTGTEVYFHYAQVGQIVGVPRGMNVVIRSDRDPLALLPAIRGEIAALDPQLPLADPRSMEGVLYASVAQPRFLALLLGIFAAVALALAAVGTYGVMSYTVAERRQEIGIRMALGAEAGRVLGMVMGQGVLIAGIGLTLGVAGAFALTRFLSTMLYAVSPTDAFAFVVAPTVLALVALLACFLPAHRATRVDPATTLRQD
jgi:putative ABC transport system permease protein